MNALMKAEDIANILRVDTRIVSEQYAHLPDFPKPVRLPSAKGKGHYRWIAEDIANWIKTLKQA